MNLDDNKDLKNNEIEPKPWENQNNENNENDENKQGANKPWENPVYEDGYELPTYKAKRVEEQKEDIQNQEETVIAEEITEKEEPKNEYSFAGQSYTPPHYNTGESGKPNDKKDGKNKAIVVLSIVCLSCVVIMAALFGVMYISDWKLPPIPQDEQTDENVQDGADNGDIPDENDSQDVVIQDGDSTETDVDIDIEGINGKDKLSYGQVYEKCSPAAVGILCTKKVTYSTMFGQNQGEEQYVGSGFIIDEGGYIVTNAHVVSGMDTIKVHLTDGREIEAILVGCDDLSDVAVVKIESESALPIMEFGDSTVLKVGDFVSAIGTPADISLAGTFTQGIISAVDREIELEDNGIAKTMKLLQTDATINPGNSGGPLLNMYGQVIGINTLKLTDEFEGIGFAIPSVYAKNIVEQIIKNNGDVSFDPENGYVTVEEKSQMGIANAQEITRYMSQIYGVPVGVQILMLDKDCSLEKNGAKVGDIITEFNDKPITNLDELRAERDKVKPREKATITVYRNREYIKITFTMGSNISVKE